MHVAFVSDGVMRVIAGAVFRRVLLQRGVFVRQRPVTVVRSFSKPRERVAG